MKAQVKNDMFLHSEFVKKNVIAIRLSPTSLLSFEDYKDLNKELIIEIQKFKLDGNTKIAQGKPVYLKPFGIADTADWMSYIKKNNDQAAFLYQYMYPSKEQKNNKSPNQAPDAKQQLFNLVLLNCDYSSDAAKASGLLYKDSLIDNQSVYTYSFSIGNKQGVKSLFEIKIDSKVLTQQPEINNFTAKLKKSVVTCKLDVNGYKEFYSAYYIEKSTDNINFKKTTTTPYVYLDYNQMKEKNKLVIEDSVSAKSPKYFYRIKGVNIFGEDSKPSNVVELKNYQEIKSFPNIDTIKTLMNKAVLLKWKMMDDKETRLIKNYILLRSDKDAGPYNSIYQNKEILQFTDKEPLSNNFYRVYAITDYDDTLKSFSRMIYLNDTIPPAVPRNLKAIIDKKGNVTVTWNKNTEIDLAGYRIFKANELHEEFVSTTEKFITDTFYTEKLPLNNLARHLFYSITATDKKYNSSAQAKPYKLRRPDTISPVKPIITNVKLLQSGIQLFFNPSKSEDVELHVLLRLNKKDKSLKTILQFTANDTIKAFVDTSAILGESYNYTLTAFDEDENKAMSSPRHVIYETGYRPRMKELNAKVDLEKRRIYLNWNVYDIDVEKYVLYRASESEPYIIIATIEGKQTTFTDKELSIGNVYSYKIKAVLKNGAESIFNQPLKVTY
ncbi:MAG: fibronectin type III domain-containing protein [Bacteroidota bacterium]